MAKEEMRNCPFCKRKVSLMHPWLLYSDEDKMWSFTHFCEVSEEKSHFCISLTSKTKEEIIDRWNGKTD